MMQDTMTRADNVLMTTYARTPVVFTKGRGATLWDAEGKEYTDFVAGIAVCNLGHAHPGVAEAVCNQAGRLVHVSNLYYTEPMIRLAELITANSFADRVFFCNSGAEANEGAIKLARKYFKVKGQDERCEIITMEKSFHGRTLATLTATGQDKIKEGFAPLPTGFKYAPFNDLAGVEARIDDKTAAIMVEPVQGEGGVIVPDKSFLQGLRSICDQKGILLIFDEVQVGLGRLGSLFGYQKFETTPDIMTLAKGLANGLPMGAVTAVESVAAAFTPGSHATTFGAGPVISSAGVVVLETLTGDGFLDQVEQTSAHFIARLKELGKHDCVKGVRGMGLLLGLELDRPASPIQKALFEAGFIVNVTQETILRFVPPLIITLAEIDNMIETLDRILSETK